jgi:hypothetical protein
MGASPEQAYVAHECRGRLRLKVPGRRGQTEFFRRLAVRVAAAPGVAAVEANPAIGSILVRHSFDGAEARGVVAAHGGLAIASGAFRARAVIEDVRRFAGGLDREVTRATSGELDLWSAAFIALLALGFNDLRRGNIAAPAWYTAFWYAFNVLLKTPENGRAQGG